jgi:hypothetical protein
LDNSIYGLSPQSIADSSGSAARAMRASGPLSPTGPQLALTGAGVLEQHTCRTYRQARIAEERNHRYADRSVYRFGFGYISES